MFRYYQQSEWSDWVLTRDNNVESPWDLANRVQATRVTVLAVSSDPDIPRQQGQAVSYSGPLYFDVDNADLTLALQAARSLCSKLIAMDVDESDLEIHLSGKKGVHIYLNPKVFAHGEALQSPYLLEAYAKIAHSLWVEGLDFQVYSKLKGRMVRPANVGRPDGRYKVKVSLAELKEMDVAKYEELTSKPRESSTEHTGELKFANKLSRLYLKALVPTKIDPRHSPVPSTAFADMDGTVPECIQFLSEGKRVEGKGDGKTTFNAVSVQLACWVKSAAPPHPIVESLCAKTVRNTPSSTGVSDEVRLKKLEATLGYVGCQPNYTFSCQAIKSVLAVKPNCSSCPVSKNIENEGPLGSNLTSIFLYERFNNYYSDKDCSSLVATFKMQRDCLVMNEQYNTIESSVVSITNGLNGTVSKINDFHEDAWLSKQNLKKELSGIDGVTFLGSDNDVARLRMTLARDDLISGAEIKQIMKSTVAGIIYRKREGPEDPRAIGHKGRLIYVEQDFSINDVGIMDSHHLVGNVLAIPKLRHRDFNLPISEDNNRAFGWLLDSNSERSMSMMLPWFLGSHLKTHIYTLEQRFPLLCISGSAGTGKNATTKVMMRLMGVSGEDAKWTLEAPNCTKFPFQHALSNTTTIPRVVNEVNPKSLEGYAYKTVIEMLKAAFDSQSISKGTIGGGDRSGQGVNVSTHSWRITSPVVSLSEEPITIPAVMQRSVQVELSKFDLRTGQPSFSQLEPRADNLTNIGVCLVKNAIKTSMKQVLELWDTVTLPDEVLYSDLQERNKFNFKVLLLAYEWAIPVLRKEGLSQENLAKLEKLKKAFIKEIKANIKHLAYTSGITEVDKVMKDIALMSALDHSTMSFFLQNGTHYQMADGIVYLDMMTIYPRLQMYKSALRGSSPLAITTEEAFLSLVKSMPYFIDYGPKPDIFPSTGRPILALSVDHLNEAGVPCEFFAVM